MTNSLIQAAQTAPARPENAQPPRKEITLQDAKDTMRKQLVIDRSLRNLLKVEGPIKRKTVIDMSVDLVAKRVLSPQVMAGYLSSLPEEPEKILEWAAAHASTVEAGLNQLMQMLNGVDAGDAART